MSTVPTDLRDLDAGWEDPQAGADPAGGSTEANTKVTVRPKPAAAAGVEACDREDQPTAPVPARREDARETLPPPVPISELVAHMMSPEIDSSLPPAALPPQLSAPKPPARASEPGARRRPASSPTIEAVQFSSEGEPGTRR